MKEYFTVLERRQIRWKKALITDEGEMNLGRGRRLKRFIRKGIPMDKRTDVWMAISGASRRRQQEPNLYLKMLEKKTSPDGILVEQISVDIPRTFPSNVKFSSDQGGDVDKAAGDDLQQSLFNVLLAFSNSNSSIGYCQGLNYVAGILLIITANEDRAFWLLKALVEDILPNYYAPNIPGLLTDVRVIEELLKERCPLVHSHAKDMEMPWELVLTKWLMCLFVDVLPVETALRVLDCLFYEGSKILVRVALTVILVYQDDLRKAKNLSDLVACFKDCTKSKKVLECHDFMNVSKLLYHFNFTNILLMAYKVRIISLIYHCKNVF